MYSLLEGKTCKVKKTLLLLSSFVSNELMTNGIFENSYSSICRFCRTFTLIPCSLGVAIGIQYTSADLTGGVSYGTLPKYYTLRSYITSDFGKRVHELSKSEKTKKDRKLARLSIIQVCSHTCRTMLVKW